MYLIFLHKVVKKRRSTLRIREEPCIQGLKVMNSGGLHIIWNLSGAQEIQIPDLTSATPDAAVRVRNRCRKNVR